jgi:cobalt-zinc-cadmium efflux system membrane fusion protein
LSEGKRRTAGIRVEPVRRGTLTEVARLTGKLALNEDRIAHIHPPVEGRVHAVKVQFGDQVKAGQVLAIVDSQQVGRTKLELFKSIQDVRLAKVNYEWQQSIRENTQAMIASLEKGLPITEIEKQFGDRPMGEYRLQLLAAYAELHKARADHSRLTDVSGQGVVPAKQLIAAKATLDAAQATFSAAMEQIRFTSPRNELVAKQDLEKAQTTEAINRELLGILGYHELKPEDIDPAIQKETISHYTVTAPFDGTVITKDVVLLDQVDSTKQMLSIADFATVWVQADVYEKYLPLLQQLSNKVVRFRVESYPGRAFEARVFYLGNMVDAKTRTVDMRAIVDNPDRILKPGMFVELELPTQGIPGVLQVPASAIQTHEKSTFVFVQKGEGLFERRDVRVGRAGNGVVEITAGVKEGEPVVVEGAFALKSEMLSDLMGEEG